MSLKFGNLLLRGSADIFNVVTIIFKIIVICLISGIVVVAIEVRLCHIRPISNYYYIFSFLGTSFPALISECSSFPTDSDFSRVKSSL